MDALQKSHDVDRCPLVWPRAPNDWLTPSTLLVASIAIKNGEVVGHVLLTG